MTCPCGLSPSYQADAGKPWYTWFWVKVCRVVWWFVCVVVLVWWERGHLDAYQPTAAFSSQQPKVSLLVYMRQR